MGFKKNFILLFFVLLSLRSIATHIVGGEIYYDNLGGNNYRITLKLYRDCFTGIAAYDNPASIFIFNSAGIFIDSLEIPFPGSIVLPSTLNNPCFTPPTNICVEEAIYQAVINLPPTPGGYDIVYQRCCRNNTILNLDNPGDVGSTYMAHIPDASQANNNSSPRFVNFPPIFLCAGIPLSFDHSATDPDGDSLYYELCDPFTGLDPGCPILGVTAGPGCPQIPSPPPYTFVPWLGTGTGTPIYNATFPMNASPAVAVNGINGLMTGTPTTLGQWVVGVCVSEYRNGILLDVNKRDFQFNVVNCPNLPVASIPNQQTFCNGFQVNFNQTSLNAFTYHWNFGDPSTTLDTSNVMMPSWTYNSAGTYTVTLIINPGTLCADTASNIFLVEPLLDPSFISPSGECLESNSFNFTAGGSFEGTGTFIWNFGVDASPSISNLQNPSNVVFNSSGNFPVTLTITENGCTESYTGAVQVHPRPQAIFSLSSSVSCILNPVQFINNSTGNMPLSYFWDFDNGQTSTLQNPVITYSSVGVYNVSLVVTSAQGCKDTVTLPNQLSVQNPPVADFSTTTNCDNFQVDFSENAVGASYYHWDFGDAAANLDTSNLGSPSWTYTTPGTYTVTLVVNPGSSCTADTTGTFILYPLLQPDFISPPGQCDYENNFAFTAGGAFQGTGSFSWDFGANAFPSSSNLQNPSNIIFNSAGTYPVKLTITEHGCTKSAVDTAHVYPKPYCHFGLTAPVGCVLDAVHFIDSSISDTPLIYNWDFGNGQTSTLQNPYTIYETVGTYNINLMIETQHGCRDTVEFPVSLNVYTTPIAGFAVYPRDTNTYYPYATTVDQSQFAVDCWMDWDDGTSSSNCDTTHHYMSAGQYILMQIVVNEYGCYDTAYSTVDIFPQYLFWVPNAFTPFNNGENDIFKPVIAGVHNYKFLIFDRWGEKIFETTNINNGWDGYYKGKLCTNDVFVYKISFQDDVENKSHQYIGRVTLVK